MVISGLNLLIHTTCMMIGASLGIGISFIVNCALIEVSKSKLFSIVILFFLLISIIIWLIKYFAISFLVIGFYILIRSLRSLYTSYQNPDYIQVNHKENFRHRYLFSLSLIIIFASFFAFVLHTQFVLKLHYVIKIPIYAILGKLYIKWLSNFILFINLKCLNFTF